MVFPIIWGWGSKSKKIGDAGYMNCNNCNNFSWFTIRQLAKEFNLYFISVAKWNRKYYLVCEICNAGYEIDKDKINNILFESQNIPDQIKFDEIWNKLQLMSVCLINQKTLTEKNIENWIGQVTNNLILDGYRESWINYTMTFFKIYLIKNLSIDNTKPIEIEEKTTQNYFYCAFCGAKLPIYAAYCNKCGKKKINILNE